MRRRYTPIKRNATFGLNITSMTDMFTILLVFLLQTYGSSEVNIEPVNGLRLPSSSSEKNPVDSVKIAVSKELVKFEDRTIAEIKGSDFENKDIDPKDSNFIIPLFNELDKLAKTSDKQFVKDGKILLQADADLPYATLRKVMYTAAMAGFPQLKLVTVAGQ
jgi:biopolymer transport protein ExbD